MTQENKMINIINKLGGQVNPERIYDHQVCFEYNGFEMYISNNRKPKMFSIGISRPIRNRNANHYDSDSLWEKVYSSINVSQSKTIENIVHNINQRFDWKALNEVKDIYKKNDQEYKNQAEIHRELVKKIAQLTGLEPRDSNDGVSTRFDSMPKGTYGEIYVTYESVSFEIKGVDNKMNIEKICKVLGEMNGKTK